MSRNQYSVMVLALLVAVVVLSACGKTRNRADENSAERVGNDIAEGFEEAGQSIERSFEDAGMATPDPDDP